MKKYVKADMFNFDKNNKEDVALRTEDAVDELLSCLNYFDDAFPSEDAPNLRQLYNALIWFKQDDLDYALEQVGYR